MSEDYKKKRQEAMLRGFTEAYGGKDFPVDIDWETRRLGYVSDDGKEGGANYPAGMRKLEVLRDSAGTTHVIGEPEYVGAFPVRTEMTLLPADPPSSEDRRKRDQARYDREMANTASARWRVNKGTEPPWPADHKGHWWSGWPGAMCLRCGSEDPLESAMAMGWYDCYPEPNPVEGGHDLHVETWDTEEHRLLVAQLQECPDDRVIRPPGDGSIGWTVTEAPGIFAFNLEGIKKLNLYEPSLVDTPADPTNTDEKE